MEYNPTPDHLFQINDNPQLLDKNNNKYLHTMNAKLIFLSKGTIPNLQESVTFLMTRVKGPSDDYHKHFPGHQIYDMTQKHP